MCLIYSKSKTEALTKRFSKEKHGYVLCYKAVYRDGANYESLYENKKFRTGWYRSNRTKEMNKQLALDIGKFNSSPYYGITPRVYEGIHVFTYLKATTLNRGRSRAIIKCWCYKEDFVCAGNHNDAVFNKVFVLGDYTKNG